MACLRVLGEELKGLFKGRAHGGFQAFGESNESCGFDSDELGRVIWFRSHEGHDRC